MAAGRLDGRVCVVTGASGGIGAATVELFQREGARVAGVDVVADCPGDMSLQVDLTSEELVADLYRQVRERFGRIDVLFNNAGISPGDDASVLETTLEAWERVQSVNLRSVFLCCKHGIPHLLENDGPLTRVGHQHGLLRGRHGRGHLADLLHGVQGRRAGAVARAGRRVRQAGACASTPSAPAPSTRRCSKSSTPRTPSRPRAGSCTCPSAVSPRPWRSRRPRCSWPAPESSFVTASTFLVDGGLSGAYTTPLD